MSVTFGVTQVVPLVTKVGASSVNTPNNEQALAFQDHINGVTFAHTASSIVMPTVTDVLTNAAAPDTTPDDAFTMFLYLAKGIKAIINPDATNWAAAIAAITSSQNLVDIEALLKSHAHTNATNGGILNQTSTHGTVDTDLTAASIHHTLGVGATQAAAGNHLHTGTYALVSDKGATNGYASLVAGKVPDAQIDHTVTAAISYVDAASTSLFAAIGGRSLIGHVHGVSSGEATITSAGIAADAIITAKILDANVTTAKIADSAVTTAKHADASVTLVKLAANSVDASKIVDASVGTSELADSAVTTTKLLDANVTSAKIAANAITDSKIVVGGLDTSSIKDNAVTTAKIADGAITHAKLADGAILVTSPKSMSVLLFPLRKWNAVGKAVEYFGETKDLTAYVPGPGLKRYVLIEINSTGASFIVQGDVTGGTAIKPDKTPGTTGLGFVYLEYGMSFIDTTNILPWLGPDDGTGGLGSGSPVGHIHGLGDESRVSSIGLDEGFAKPTATPSFYVNVSGLHYRSSGGQVKYYSGGLIGPFSVPVSGLRTDAAYLSPATGAIVTVAGVVDPTTPVSPSFIGDQKSLFYVHMRAGATFIGASDDGLNGWVEDARTWVTSGGGPATINGVATGGTGVAAFSAGIITSPGGVNPLSSIAAPTGTVVGTTDAQTLTNKTITQASSGVIGTIVKQAAVPTVDTLQYQTSAAAVFGNVSQFKTFGMGVQELTGTRELLIGGTIVGSATTKQATGLLVSNTLQSFDNTASSVGVSVTTNHSAAGQVGATAFGLISNPARTGGDTGTFSQSIAIYGIAGTFATSNYAAVLVGLVQVTGNEIVTGTLTVSTAGSTIATEAWIAGTLTNSWANMGGTAANFSYKKDSHGMVHIKGDINAGGASTSCFVLPAGYTPTQDRTFAVGRKVSGIWTADACLITAAGSVIPINAGGAGSTNGYSLTIDFMP